jgi:hypothetical protein
MASLFDLTGRAALVTGSGTGQVLPVVGGMVM